MAGFSDYTAQAIIDWASGYHAAPALASRYLALFTTAPTSDSGSGAVEVSGGSYARAQIAGALTAGGAISTGSPNITMAGSNPGWVVSGMAVYDVTAGALLGLVSSYSGTALVLQANAAANGSGSSDSLVFAAHPHASASSGAEPATAPANATNGGVISFPLSTASWGTVVAFGIYDASTSGNLLWWDYLGNYAWKEFSCSSASPGVLTSPAHGYANGDSVVVTSKFGGTLPATAGSWAGALTVAGATTDTFNAGVNTTGTGSGMVRKITSQPIANNTTASFSASTLNLSLA